MTKKISWKVKDFNCNKQVIEDYDVLKYREDKIKKFKKKSETKEEFAEKLRREFMWQYWSRSEYELIISIDENNHIWLSPWCGCYNPNEVKVDVTDDNGFDWRGFAEEHIRQQRFENEAKIDIYDQIMYGDNFDRLVDLLWYTRLPYERDYEKFHK